MTKSRLLILGLFALITLPGTLIAAPAVNWTTRVALSPIGGHVMGNPAAPTKLVEYVSYTCSHCAHFVGEASAPLKADYVKGGRVSVEARNAVRDKYDLAAALLARCGGPKRFFGNHEALFANQDAWMEQLQAYDRGAAKPSEQIYMCKIRIPAGYAVDEMPQSKIFALPANAGRFIYNATVAGDLITIMTNLQINKSLFVQDEYRDLREFYNAVVAKQNEQVVLKKL